MKRRAVFVARASRPLGRGHPARALAGAGRSRDSGQDARATKGTHEGRPYEGRPGRRMKLR